MSGSSIFASLNFLFYFFRIRPHGGEDIEISALLVHSVCPAHYQVRSTLTLELLSHHFQRKVFKGTMGMRKNVICPSVGNT